MAKKKATLNANIKIQSYEDIKHFSKEQKIKIASQWAKRANSRLTQLEKKGFTKGAYKYAQEYFKTGKTNKAGNRYYQGKQFSTGWELNRLLKELDMFLNAKSSTISGIKVLREQRIETLRDNMIKRGYTDFKLTDVEAFNNFLDSKMFDSLAMYVPSDEILEMVDLMFESGVTVERMLDDFQLFLARNDTKSPDYDPHYKPFNKVVEEQIQEARQRKELTENAIKRATERGMIFK